MSQQNMTVDELKFKARISKMGTKRQIIIPVGMYEMIKDFEDSDLIITIKKESTKREVTEKKK